MSTDYIPPCGGDDNCDGSCRLDADYFDYFDGNDVADVLSAGTPDGAVALLIDLIDEGRLDRKTALLNLLQVVSIGLADYA